ncbi:MAG: SPFH domain-containing protein [Patescibacteria group bacterium]
MKRTQTWGEAFQEIGKDLGNVFAKIGTAFKKGTPAQEEENMHRSPSRQALMWVALVIQQIIIVVFVAWATHMITKIGWDWSLILGTTVWALFFFYGRGIDLFVVNTAPFFGCVLANPLLSYKQPVNDDDRLSFKKTACLEEVGPGLSPKWAWQKPTFIDLRKQITVRKPVGVYTNDGVKATITYIMIVAALRGFLCNLVRNTEQEAQDILVAKTQSKLIAQVSTINQQQLITDLDDLRDWFGDIHGGDKVSSEDERGCGMSATDLTIESCDRSEKFQESAEQAEIAKNTAAALGQLITAGKTGPGSVTGKQALDFIAASQGIGAHQSISISGLENITHIGGNIMFPAGEPKKKEKKKED